MRPSLSLAARPAARLSPSVLADASLGFARVSRRHLVSVIAATVSRPIRSGAIAPPTTGFVEPHFFAGFSGGPKLVAPGLAGLETTLTLHDARRIGSDQATWAVCEGNPVHDDVRAIAAATRVDFAFDVVLNREQEVVAAFGGEVLAMHAAARAFVREVAMRPVGSLDGHVRDPGAGGLGHRRLPARSAGRCGAPRQRPQLPPSQRGRHAPAGARRRLAGRYECGVVF
jgi:Lactate racemase N-terminal domain